MKIKTKLTIGAQALAFIPVLIGCFAVGWVATDSGKDALEAQAERQLTSIRDITANNIENYFNTIRNQVQTFSNDRMIIEAMAGLKPAFSDYRREVSADTPTQRAALTEYYRNDFAAEYQRKNTATALSVDGLVNRLDEDSIALQYRYIRANPNPLGEKDSLLRADDDSAYSALHERYHPHIRDYLQRFGYYDIFLVDSDTGDIIYSVFKELDYTTSLIDGPYADSGLGKAFRQANQQGIAPSSVALTDFAPYTPSYEAPAAFIASPIFEGDKKLGILIFQMPIDRINAVMTHNGEWENIGLGESGETYLVGQDYTMRSMSRFLAQDKPGYLQLMDEIGLPPELITNLSTKETSIGLQPVETHGTRAALNGETNFEIFADYRGINVLSSYKPLKIAGLDWIIMSEIDEEEAFRPVALLRDSILVAASVTVLIALVIGGGIGWLFANSIVRPINQTVAMVKDIAEGDGDLTQRLSVKSKDEIGELAHWFNSFIETLQQLVNNLNQSVESLADSSGEMEGVSVNTKNVLAVQHSQTEQMAAAITEMTASVEEVANNVQHAANQAGQAQLTSQDGQLVLNECRQAIETLANEIKDASEVIERLSRDSEEVGGVLEVIEGIAEQTNLLALNAAIEAARAGESGRGFAVVADEVRTLAQRTQDSTQKIQQIIDRLQRGTCDAVTVMGRSQRCSELSVAKTKLVTESFETIATSISDISEVTIQIASATEQQSRTTNEINNNVMEIKNSSEKTSESAEQVAGASQDLSKLSNDIRSMLRGMRT